MANTGQVPFAAVTNGRSFSQQEVRTAEMTRLSIHTIFQARTIAVASHVLERMERRDRIVLILLDGRRTIEDVIRLIHKSETEIAQVLVRLLKSGYIDYMGVRRA